MKRPFRQKSKPARRVKIGLQGGGSLGAYTAGVLHELLCDKSIEITDITGTSAGAMNGMVVAQKLNKYGNTEKGRHETQKHLIQFWEEASHPTLPKGAKLLMDFMAAANPHGTRYVVTNSLLDHIDRHIQNPRDLASGRHVNLTIAAVSTEGDERLFTNQEIQLDSLRASAAIQPYLHPVTIDGISYIDGAYLGGSNPPIEPLMENLNDTDAIIFIMTNPPEHPITQRKQSDLTHDDVLDTDGLILHQTYDHIAQLLYERENGKKIPPIHIIWPDVDRPFTQEQKQQIDANFISRLFRQGQMDAQTWRKYHGQTIEKKSSHSLNRLKTLAYNRCALTP